MYLWVLSQLAWQDIDFAKIQSDMEVMNSLLTVHIIVIALGWDGREVKTFFFSQGSFQRDLKKKKKEI